MNVENRKLFRNKDARARLAGMGGIIASSPELLGTVQKFQDAGPVVPSTFLVQLPGLVGGNEFLQLTAAELQLLNQKQPGLMSSEGVMIQEATPEILSTLNPAQYNTTNNPNIKRMFADLGVELSQAPTVVEPQALVEPESSGILSQIKSLFNKEDDTVSSNVAPSMTSEITTDQPPVVDEDSTGKSQGLIGILKRLADPYSANIIGTDESGRGSVFGLPPANTRIGDFLQGFAKIPSRLNEAMYSSSNSMVQALSDAYDSGFGVPYLLSPSEKLQQSKEDFRAEEEQLMNLRGGLNTMSITEGEVAAKKTKDEIKRLEAEDKAKTEKEQTAAAAADKLNPQGPNFVLNPDKIKKDLDEGGSGSNALLNVEIDKKLSPKESVKEFQSMYKEMLGMDDEDKEKEKWHQMAMIGFAIAAGQDPSALANIAGGLLEGTKMMKADRTRKQDRDDKITMMAIQSAEADRRDRMAEERAIAAEERKATTAEGVATTAYDRARITAKELAAATIEKERVKAQGSGQKMSPLEPFSDQIAILAKELLAAGQVTDLKVGLQLAAEAYMPYYVNQSTVGTTGSKLTVEEQIKKLKDAGKSDAEIRQMLIDANKDPTKFGL